MAAVPKIIYNRDNRLQVNLPDQDLTGKQVHVRILSAAAEDVKKELVMTNAAGVIDDAFADGTIFVDITAIQSRTWPINTIVVAHMSIFNTDNTLFGHGDIKYKIEP